MAFSWTPDEELRLHIQIVRGIMAASLPPPDDPFTSLLGKLVLDSGSKMIRPYLALLGAQATREESGAGTFPVPGMTGTEAFALGRSMAILPRDHDALAEEAETDRDREGQLFPCRIYRLAAALELLHTASLVHDDIIDNAPLRRGIATLHSTGSLRRAILAGDYLFSTALLLTSPWADAPSARKAAQALQLLCRGEVLQDRGQDPEHPSMKLYRRQIAGKTATLFVLSLRGGAELQSGTGKSGPSPLPEALGRWAYGIGMAFQIRDDLLDFSLESAQGKSTFRDFAQGLHTHPLIAALRNRQDGDNELEKFCRRHRPDGKALKKREQEKLRALILKRGGFARSEEAATAYAGKAMSCLDQARTGPLTRSRLESLSAALLQR